ncbi:hypothetical protein [uncultured Deinococcus sp.]|uniref:hypothetical protein n=1 Tax=uncultured Deinococcus sp. TaxID=158789 RepID=UPI0025FE16F9|nr:hypothetical protein [uncultured Deinococcus sp.]
MTFFDVALSQLQRARPYIENALDSGFAQTVEVRRFGAPSVSVRALLGQEEDNTTDAPMPGDPGISSRTVQALLQPSAPVATPGYTVTTTSGQVLVPVAVAQDPGQQGFAWVVRLAAIVDRTRVQSLTFPVPGVGLILQPGTNNRMPAPGTSLTVAARLAATTDPRVRDSVGADTADVVLVGRWGSLLDPGARPSGVRWGSRSPLSINGQPGTLTITLAYPDSDLATEQQFGERFLAVWRAGGPP